MKSTTDYHWNERAASVENDADVNIMDLFQRDLECKYICKFLKPEMRVLEAGCGNGYSTNIFRKLVNHIDAFDYSENMIRRAKATYSETNNRFIHDNVLALRLKPELYDAVICVRLLINLRNLEEQRSALLTLMNLVKPGGLFILVEGFTEGFAGLNELRRKVELPPLEPAKINYYSSIHDILPLFSDFLKESDFSLGMYDYLTRVFYPMLVGTENVKHNTNFSEQSMRLAQELNPVSFECFSRVRGFVFRKK